MTAWIIRLILWFNRRRTAKAIAKASVDINAKCPGCGHREGSIKWEPGKVRQENGNEEVVYTIKHTCKICGAYWYENTLIDSKKLWPVPIGQIKEGK